MGCVYLITNKINNKKYVGKTTQSIEKRWQEHISDSKKERCEIRPLYRAIRKYGIENFFIEEIEKCDVDILSEREQYWIQYYNTYKDGYNATIGGDGSIILDYDKIVSSYLTYHNISEVSRQLSCHPDSVRKILSINDIPIKTSSEISREMNSKPIAQYDLNGNFIRKFSSVSDACKFFKRDRKEIGQHIGKCANGKRKTAYGFIWKWIQESE